VLNLTAISSRLGLPRSTVHRLLSALESQGFLAHEPGSHGYQLGYQLLYWGMVAQSSLDLRKESLPILRWLSQVTGETAILSVRDGSRGICLDLVESNQPVRLAMRVGRRLRLHAGASAKVLWAFLPEAEIDDILGSIELVPLEANTITDPGRLRAELSDIRRLGYAVSWEETDCGAMGVAAPVFDHAGRPIAGLGIAAPLARVPPQRVPEISAHLLEGARQLSARLGRRAPTHRAAS
jgi:DNA-binding IclR family transcriptional regulator